MSTFQELLMKQKEDAGLSDIIEQAQKESRKGSASSSKDDRIWKPSVDDVGNGFAVIRFLPSSDSKIPWVKFFDHGFKGDGGWFIENCPTTIGETCPACAANTALWNSGNEEDKNLARSRKRRVHFVSNIYVVKDPKNPENEGKVFLYQYGNKIFQKIMEAMEPVFDDDTPMNPFNLFKGADFKIKIKRVGGYWNYDSSEFASASSFMGGEEDRIMKILEQTHPISEFTSKDNYKSYAELETKLNRVLNGTSSSSDSGESYSTAPAKQSSQVAEKTAPSVEETSSGSVDDDLEYYKQIAAQMS